MKAEDFIEGLRELSDEGHREKLAHFGIPNAHALGVKMPLIRSYLKPFRGDAELALQLFESDYHEAKLAACMIFPAKSLSLDQADYFMQGLYSWDLVDQFCSELFQKAKFAKDLPYLWAPLPGEFQRRSGLVMIASLAMHHKKMPDQDLLEYWSLLVDTADDSRNFVKKAHSWVLRTLGKRSPWLHNRILALIAEEWEANGAIKCWPARDAWKELNDPKIIARIEERAARKKG